MKIKAVKAFKLLNSNASETIAVIVKTRGGSFVSAAPSGASVGKKEAESYRRNVDTSIRYFNSRIASVLRGFRLRKFEDFEKLEKKIVNLYANPTIALEFALLKALASSQHREIYELLDSKTKKFPVPLGKAIGGGAHAGVGDVQEYLFAPDTSSFSKAAFVNSKIYNYVQKQLVKQDKQFFGGKDAEGGWVTSLPVTEILKLCLDVKQYAETKLNCNVDLGVDVAASQFYKRKRYNWTNYSKTKKSLTLTKQQQIDTISGLMLDYKLEYVEDPFEENDFSSFAELTSRKMRKMICADDLTCTNPDLLREVIKRRAATAVIVKPNQIGSLVKTKEFVDVAKGFGLKIVVSHRSGSLAEPVLSHLVLGLGADYFKCGIAGGERVGKINELIRLENRVDA